jgi:membrane protein
VADRVTQPRLTPLALLAFAGRVGRGFVANGSFDRAGTVAYNGLLSVVPLCLLATAAFSPFVDRERFVRVVMRELRQLIPARTAAPVTDALRGLLEAPYSGGLFSVVTLLFFSTLAFRSLQHALDAIFSHRRAAHPPRSLLFSMLVALAYVVAIGVASLLQTLAVVRLDCLPWLASHLPRWSALLGLVGMALLLASIYRFMPFGRGRFGHAVIGGVFAALLWQGVQQLLAFYLENVSSVNAIYGSLAALIVVLFSFELAACIVLLGAQLVAELEQSRNADRPWYAGAAAASAAAVEAPGAPAEAATAMPVEEARPSPSPQPAHDGAVTPR